MRKLGSVLIRGIGLLLVCILNFNIVYALDCEQYSGDSLLLCSEIQHAVASKSSFSYFNREVLDEAFELAKRKKLESFYILRLEALGVEQRNSANYHASIAIHQYTLDCAIELDDQKLIARANNNIGVAYRRMYDYQPAMEYHLKALNISEKINDRRGVSIATNSIGNIEYLLGNNQKALEYFQKGLVIEKELNYNRGIAINLNNIGNVYKSLGQYSKALEFYRHSLEVNIQSGNKKGEAICYNDIGEVYKELENYELALDYFERSMAITSETNDRWYLLISYISLGRIKNAMNQPTLALPYLLKAEALAQEILAKGLLYQAQEEISYNYKLRNNYRKALEYYELAMINKDSVLTDEKSGNVALLQSKFENERMNNQLKLMEQRSNIQELDSKRQKTITLIFIIVLLFTIVMVLTVFYILRNKIKTNKILVEKGEELNKAQNELEKYADSLLEAKNDAEKANRAKSLFLANISHEIRTPLNTVIGFTDLLTEMVDNEKYFAYLEAIKKSSGNLLGLLNDLLDLSKIDSGKIDIEYGDVNIRELVYEISELFYLKLLEKKLELIVDIDKTIPKSLYLCDNRLRQVLINLVSNAIKFTAKGRIEIKIKGEKEPGEDSMELFIHVVDTGKGIPKEEHERIFEYFTQKAGQSESKYGGSGLGLAISKRLVELMNGTIRLNSKPGNGSEFIMEFPHVAVLEEHVIDNVTDTYNPSQSANSLPEMKLLVIDDVDDNRSLITECFRDTKVKVEEAYNGKEGLNKIMSQPPDIILLDIRMPIMNGLELIDILKADDNLKHIPVIAITASNRLDNNNDHRLKWFEGIIVKPIRIKELLLEIHKCVSRLGKEKEIPHHFKMDSEISELMIDWQKVVKKKFIHEIKEFGNTVLLKGQKYRIREFEQLGKDILLHSEHVDIEQVEQLLMQFPEIFESITKLEQNTTGK